MTEAIQDVAAERAVLAGLFAYGSDAYADVADLLDSKAFTDPTNQLVYRCARHVLDSEVEAQLDYASLLSAAHTLGVERHFEPASEKRYLQAVINFPVKRENVRKLAGKLGKLAVARHLRSQHEQAMANLQRVTGDEPIDHILGLSEQPILDVTAALTTTQGEGPQRIGEGARGYIDYLAANQRDTVGISTGYPTYDLSIGGGLRPRTVNVIGARPKIGKTALSDNMALHIATGNVPVLNLDTEMAREDHWNRMLACLSGVTIQDIETGKFAQNSHRKQQLHRAIDRLEALPYDYLSIAGQPFEETLSHMRRWVRKVGLQANGLARPCVIIFDYLKLMSAEAMENRNLAEFQVLGFMMTGLHNFMVRWGVPCLAFIQLNRDGIAREDTDVVSGSDRVVWLCSNLSIFKKKSEEEMAEQAGNRDIYNRKLVPLVARHGAGLEDGDYINMMFHRPICKIVEGPTRNNLLAGSGAQPRGKLIDDAEQPAVDFA